jgi:catechol 2,3-dioxygenase-like lactoylglutathione lyase family enzyme
MDKTSNGQVLGFFHVGITVSDMDEALGFYRDVLGLEVESDSMRVAEQIEPVVGVSPESVRVVFLTVPGCDAKVELFQYSGIEQFSASGRPWDIAAGHFCLYVDDAAAVYERLLAAGYRSRRPLRTIPDGPHRGASAVYTIGPDGYHVELYQRRTAEVAPIAEAALTTADY